MHLKQRIDLLVRLGDYMLSDDAGWNEALHRASLENNWFIPEFIKLQVTNIAEFFLERNQLEKFAALYNVPRINPSPKRVGIIMAGNIPLVGFHDFLCTFLSGHQQMIKLSSKDAVLLKHLVEKLIEWEPELQSYISFSVLLKKLDAYIATGSNNSSRYFDFYFKKYPHIIRRNRTSVAVLSGRETIEELGRLADDVHQFFGLGCRNVTKIYVTKDYDFVPFLEVFRKYEHLVNYHKYKNNYDYQLAVLIINKRYYMTNESIILVEDKSLFAPISQLNYEYYTGDVSKLHEELSRSSEVQCIVGKDKIPFGKSQVPAITDFADGIDTMKFLLAL